METKAIPTLIWWELKLFDDFLSQASNWVKCHFLGDCVFCISSRAFSSSGMVVFLMIKSHLNCFFLDDLLGLQDESVWDDSATQASC